MDNEQAEMKDAGREIMDRLERQFLEMIATERLTESRRYVPRTEDHLKRSDRVRESSQFGWIMHSCFRSIRSSVFGLTDESGLAMELIGSIDHGVGTDPPWEHRYGFGRPG